MLILFIEDNGQQIKAIRFQAGSPEGKKIQNYVVNKRQMTVVPISLIIFPDINGAGVYTHSATNGTHDLVTGFSWDEVNDFKTFIQSL